MFAVEIVLSSHLTDTTSLEAAILDFPFPVKPGSILVSAIGIAVVEKGGGQPLELWFYLIGMLRYACGSNLPPSWVFCASKTRRVT